MKFVVDKIEKYNFHALHLSISALKKKIPKKKLLTIYLFVKRNKDLYENLRAC